MSTKKTEFEIPEIKMPDSEKLAENYGQIMERSQKLVEQYVQKQSAEAAFSVPDPGVIAKTFMDLGNKMMKDPAKLVRQQAEYWKDYMNLWQSSMKKMQGAEDAAPVVAPDRSDKRFKDDEWAENAVFDFIKQSYLLSARSIQSAVADVEGLDEDQAKKVDFYTRQFVDAMAPTNFVATNPAVLKATLESGGENLVNGLKNLLDDMEAGDGQLRVKMTDTSVFTLGENVAVTPGKVVFQNDLMQLIQYNPSTEKVFKKPLLIIPPWINKFYILDLRDKNSYIKWAVDKGFTVFVISWVNPDETLAEKDFEDYVSDGTLAALDAIEQATGEKEANAVAYCIGGTLLASTLAYMAANKDDRIKSATFFTTMLDFADSGELSVFIDEEQIGLIEQHMEEKGYLEGSKMAQVFNMLKANDLIWSFVIKNYLLGQDPFPFDLLFWNSDSTRMPRKMHSFYLRNMYQHNKLREPGGITLLGEPLELSNIKTPAYFISTREDHIAPWKSTYAGAKLLGGPVKFVLGGSGHIAGVINPEGSPKYGYSTNSKLPDTAEAWEETATPNEGSWWPDWYKWASRKAGTKIKARVPGDGKLKVIEDAPGSYVKLRIG